MLIDKRIVGIAACVAKESRCPVLKKVFIKKNTAVASDGCILARCRSSISDDYDFPGTAPGAIEETGVLLEPDVLKKAFRNGEAKTHRAAVEMMRIGQEGDHVIVQYLDESETPCTELQKVIGEQYPDYEKVFPKGRPEVTFSLDGKLLKRVCDMAIKFGDGVTNRITFRVEAVKNRPVTSAIKFEVVNHETGGIDGVIMPLRGER